MKQPEIHELHKNQPTNQTNKQINKSDSNKTQREDNKIQKKRVYNPRKAYKLSVLRFFLLIPKKNTIVINLELAFPGSGTAKQHIFVTLVI